jgi:hypothetical protein
MNSASVTGPLHFLLCKLQSRLIQHLHPRQRIRHPRSSYVAALLAWQPGPQYSLWVSRPLETLLTSLPLARTEKITVLTRPDVLKTRIQTQINPLDATSRSNSSSLALARTILRKEGLPAFYRGLGICSIRAFFVNAVQWGLYEWAYAVLQQ